MIDLAEQLPCLINNLKTFQLVPVVITVGQIREQAARNTDLITSEKTCFITVIKTLKLRDQEFITPAPTDQLYLFDTAITPKRPGLELQQVCNRISKGIHLHFTANAMY